MADKTTFGFDPDKMMEFFKQNDFTRAFSDVKLPNFDTEALFAAQKKNMDALVEANKAAAAGYQDLFKKQMAIFEETISEAQKQIQDMELKMDSKTAAAQGEVAKAAFEKAIANMKELAETAQKANTEAYEIVSARVKESVEELRSLADTLKTKK
ncbi:phasin family protein [Halovulum sp. GXIMD14794]